MDALSIASLSMSMSQYNTSMSVGMAMLKNNLDMAEQVSMEMLDMLDTAVIPPTGSIDISI